MTISQHIAQVFIDGKPLTPLEGTCKIDRSWSPYVQADFTLPASAALALLDPRKSPPPRVYITARQVFGESTKASAVSAKYLGRTADQMSTLFAGLKASEVSSRFFYPWNTSPTPHGSTSRQLNLTLRTKRTNYAEQTVTIEASSDEALLQDYALVSTEERVFQSTSVRTIVSMVLRTAGFALTPGTADGTIEDDSAIWEPGVSAWDFLAPYVQQAGLRLWSDGSRGWHLQKDNATTPGHVSLSTAKTVTALEYEVSRGGDWADAVVIKYTWDDANGDTQTRYDVARTGAGTKAIQLHYEQRYPGPGAAKHVLRRKNALGQVIPVTAVSSYNVEPGQSFDITAVGQPKRTGHIEAVEWTWPDDEMTITTTDTLAK